MGGEKEADAALQEYWKLLVGTDLNLVPFPNATLKGYSYSSFAISLVIL